MSRPRARDNEPADLPRRIRVTSPRTTAHHRQTKRTGAGEIGDLTRLGEVYMTSLIHAHLRLALAIIGCAASVLIGLPLVFALVPASRDLNVFGLPLPWLLLGILAYPLTYFAARLYVRQAERIEAAFTEFVERP
jgi:hypothetical protein